MYGTEELRGPPSPRHLLLHTEVNAVLEDEIRASRAELDLVTGSLDASRCPSTSSPCRLDCERVQVGEQLQVHPLRALLEVPTIPLWRLPLWSIRWEEEEEEERGNAACRGKRGS